MNVIIFNTHPFRPKNQIAIAICTTVHPALITEHKQYIFSFFPSVKKNPIVEKTKTIAQNAIGTYRSISILQEYVFAYKQYCQHIH